MTQSPTSAGPGTTAPVYDGIGAAYSRYRRPDPRIASMITAALGDARRVLNVGAGTGSYEPTDRAVVALEPSPVMIRQRSRTAAPCVRGDASRLPFEDGEFDAAMAILTVHHWDDPVGGLRELSRVANRLVIFAFDPTIHNDFWLFREYVPAVRELPSTAGAPTIESIADAIDADRVEAVLVPHDCEDGFGCAYWRRPHAYLEPDVRQCISALGLLEPAAVLPGVERLRDDLETGRWQDRHAALMDLTEFDGGLRLVVRESR